jgi:hypothetical protein
MMIVAPVLVVTGVVSVQWDSGLPKVSIDGQRAKELEVRAVDSLQKLREQETGLLSLRPRMTPQEEFGEPEPQQNEYPIANLSEILKSLR